MGTDRATSASAVATAGEHVGPSDYPADEALGEMVDSFEALLCWFYLPAGGGNDGDSNGASGSGGINSGGRDDHGIACFVAYRDEGKHRHSAAAAATAANAASAENVGEGGKNAQMAELEQKRAAIAARARGRRREQDGRSQNSGSSLSGGSSDGADGKEDGLDAHDFEPGALRVRVILSGLGTTEKLRKATGVFLSAARNRNPVRKSFGVCTSR